MLLWQRKNMPKFAFSAQLSFVIVVLHGAAVLLLCLSSVGVHDELHVVASQSYLLGADIIVVPFARAAPKQAVQQPKKQAPAAVPASTVCAQAPVQEKPVSVTPAAPVKPVVPTPSSILPASSSILSLSKDNPQPAQPVKHISTREQRAAAIQQALVAQIQLHWQPPEGFDSAQEVILTISLDASGGVEDVCMQQSSGIFACDVHARSAVYRMDFPKACWGKKVTISFK